MRFAPITGLHIHVSEDSLHATCPQGFGDPELSGCAVVLDDTPEDEQKVEYGNWETNPNSGTHEYVKCSASSDTSHLCGYRPGTQGAPDRPDYSWQSNCRGRDCQILNVFAHYSLQENLGALFFRPLPKGKPIPGPVRSALAPPGKIVYSPLSPSYMPRKRTETHARDCCPSSQERLDEFESHPGY
jgi:hypothetical protein